MSTLTDALALSKPADGDSSWGAEIRDALDTLDYLAQPNNIYYVAPIFTQANLFPNGVPSDRRHFDTIQAAITAIEASASAGQISSTIMVYPDQYDESLTFTRSVNLVGVGGLMAATVRGTYPKIKGQGTNPVITFNPAAGDYFGISFTGLIFEHAYTSTASTQAWPLLMNVTDQGAGNYGGFQNKIVMDNCHFRDDVAEDEFDYLIRCQGFNRLAMNLCTFKLPTGANNYEKPISIEGNDAQGKEAQLYIKRSEFNHSGVDDQTIYMDNRSAGIYYRNGSVRSVGDIVTFGGTGSNDCSGLSNQTEFDDYGNLDSVIAAG